MRSLLFIFTLFVGVNCYSQVININVNTQCHDKRISINCGNKKICNINLNSIKTIAYSKQMQKWYLISDEFYPFYISNNTKNKLLNTLLLQNCKQV